MKKTNTTGIPAHSVIDNRVFEGRQSTNLIRLLKTPKGKKLRIEVKRDTYQFQSHARIELWSDGEGKWNFVHSLPYPEMACVKTPSASAMEEDAQTLLRTALLIIEE